MGVRSVQSNLFVSQIQCSYLLHHIYVCMYVCMYVCIYVCSISGRMLMY